MLGTSTGLIIGGQAFDVLTARKGYTELDAYRAMFWIYTAIGLIKAISILLLSQRCERQEPSKICRREEEEEEETEPLLPAADSGTHPTAIRSRDAQTARKGTKEKKGWNPFSSISPKSRAILFKLCSLFFLDSLGSGMMPFSLINFYLDRKFGLPKGKLGGIMSATWYVHPLRPQRPYHPYSFSMIFHRKLTAW